MSEGRSLASSEELIDLVRRLKKERQVVILAHNYQEGPIQEVADFIGDSLKLAQFATQVEEPVILFCGVHFMAETAAMLCPDKTVLVPDLAAGCSLADTAVPSQIRHWRQQHPGGVVVCYINTSADVKAECDYCCTSSNGVEILRAIPPEKEILFVPDFYLGSYLKAKTGRNIHLWKGYCPSHATIDSAQIEQLQEEHPEAEFLMHPECGCTTKQMDLADQVLSTDGMIRYVKEASARSFIVATDNGILYRMRKENPEKEFLPASENASCFHMQRNTLPKVFRSLVTMRYPVTVPEAVAERALISLRRMMEITQQSANLSLVSELRPKRDSSPQKWREDEMMKVRWNDPVLEVANDLS